MYVQKKGEEQKAVLAKKLEAEKRLAEKLGSEGQEGGQGKDAVSRWSELYKENQKRFEKQTEIERQRAKEVGKEVEGKRE